MTVLITGGAGYIGSHVVRLLRERGDDVIIVDDLVTGDRGRVAGIPLIQMDLALSDAPASLDTIMRRYGVRAVIHFAGRKQVKESVERPAWYYQQNIGSLANVLTAMERAQISELVFSSSAAVYGASEGSSLREDSPTLPVNPYGESKLVGEWLVAASVKSANLRASSLRYFNVAGAGWPELGDTAVLNLVPMVFARIDQQLAPLIFGEDYATPDGTCIRDYIHVLDLAEAHLAMLDSLATGDNRHDIFNVGTGTGSSVREMVDAILRESGADLAPRVQERRMGDPAVVVADPRSIANAVGWVAKRTLTEIIASAWESHQSTTRPKTGVSI